VTVRSLFGGGLARSKSSIAVACFAVAIGVIGWQWVNSRIAILRANQSADHPVVPTTYFIYRSMAAGLREGRVGQINLAALRRHAALNDTWAPFERSPQDPADQWVDYYALDIGYSFVVEVAHLAFPSLPDNHLRPLALQLVADALLVGFVCFMFSQWHPALGLLAAFLYTCCGVFYDLVSFPFYYYWDIPLTFFVLAALLFAYRRPAQRCAWMIGAALALGFGVWLRGSWWPIAFYLFVLAAATPSLRKQLLVPAVVFALVAAPQVVRSSKARGQLTLSTRALWHVALVGLGYYPNPYGLEASDRVIFELTHRKYGINLQIEDYRIHDQAAKQEYMAIWRKDRGFVVRSFLGRLKESILGSTQTSVLSFIVMSNVTYRVWCLLGLLAMVWRGDDRRFLGIAAAGTYAIYVLLTSIFYFVGLAYDNVSEAALLVLFMGAIDSTAFLAHRAWQRRPLSGFGFTSGRRQVASGA
jgi:hypothetical protein